jgi:hypothetical protein
MLEKSPLSRSSFPPPIVCSPNEIQTKISNRRQKIGNLKHEPLYSLQIDQPISQSELSLLSYISQQKSK